MLNLTTPHTVREAAPTNDRNARRTAALQAAANGNEITAALFDADMARDLAARVAIEIMTSERPSERYSHARQWFESRGVELEHLLDTIDELAGLGVFEHVADSLLPQPPSAKTVAACLAAGLPAPAPVAAKTVKPWSATMRLFPAAAWTRGTFRNPPQIGMIAWLSSRSGITQDGKIDMSTLAVWYLNVRDWRLTDDTQDPTGEELRQLMPDDLGDHYQAAEEIIPSQGMGDGPDTGWAENEHATNDRDTVQLIEMMIDDGQYHQADIAIERAQAAGQLTIGKAQELAENARQAAAQFA